ncbi:zinc-dependent metalloprotease [Porphyromonas crevioricanis]|uniref:Glutamyl- and glutaminyl-tRNA synthetases n=1 Tax=Porphyromonas crevioricanis TaxID=393921 RepID=A0AB34PFB9_9PORP|nr:zinc-dependent metalloprotease [Porphyromonas crevioricanis]KGN93752.1 hypothetical protein HQ38_08215 [Porphyromonas crevioricanis]
MKKVKMLAMIALCAAMALPMTSCRSRSKAARAKAKKEVKAPSKFDQAIADAKKQEGPFSVYFTKKNKLYFALPDSAFSREYLLASRVAATSKTNEVVAGQMNINPFLIRFSKDNTNVYLHRSQYLSTVRQGDAIEPSYKRNFLDPILKAFPIVDTKDGNVLIEVTEFFTSDEKSLSPLVTAPPAMQSRYIQGSLSKSASNMMGVKVFPQNIEIKSLLTYQIKPLGQPYTLQMNRSILLLPKKPVRMRLQDNRVGFFRSFREHFTTDRDKVEKYALIHRWDLQPKDSAAYFRGELVEPIKPIIFYVDSAFPDKWRSIVKQGVEDWNIAFEAAGFKNAIQAKDYPKDDPDFDPDDIRYSCIKYATTSTANAMGPSYVDPRSGQIICADVIWYHNVISLVHRWRFAQTAAVDPQVRKPVFDDEVMRKSLRYVTSHEVGHTLGLMHNMGASYSFPIDSLRNPGFTQKYGTTPSIMDYARNNFVAQPGDLERGVSLTPPVLGVYDIHAIRWGYRLIPEAQTAEDERPTLNKWIMEKADDPMYTFGAQQFPHTIDPTDQMEDLGNDHLKAGDLSISNLKIISKNAAEWLMERDKRYDDIHEIYGEIIGQYFRHISHVKPYIGGIIFNENRQGDQQTAYTYVPRSQQLQAMKWLAREARTFHTWLITPEQQAVFTNGEYYVHPSLRASIVRAFFNPSALMRIYQGELSGEENSYALSDYTDDAVKVLFEPSIKGKKLSSADIDIEALAIGMMLKASGLVKEEKSGSNRLQDEEELLATKFFKEEQLPCALGYRQGANANDMAQSFARITIAYRPIPTHVIAPLWMKQLKEIRRIYTTRKNATDKALRAHYEYQIMRIDNALSGKNL